VARTKTRDRALARAKVERQIARRAATARRRRQLQAGVGVFVALAVVGFAVAWGTGLFGDDKQGPSTGANCTWNSNEGSGVKDVGEPKSEGLPQEGTQLMTVTTNQGVVEVEVDLTRTPCTAASFSHLAGKKFFDNTRCHRLTTSVLQCGDPAGTGRGGPSYRFDDENLPGGSEVDPNGAPASRPASVVYPAGTVAMANSGANTNGSQFFIVYKDTLLPPDYAIFGKVTKGLDVVEKVGAGGIGTGGAGANDGPPKLETVIQSLAMSAVKLPSPEPVPSGSAPASTEPSASPSA